MRLPETRYERPQGECWKMKTGLCKKTPCRHILFCSSLFLALLQACPSHAFNSVSIRLDPSCRSVKPPCRKNLKSFQHVTTESTCNLRKPSSLSLKMNGDPQWYAFSQYNLGRWQGKALHIDPTTGEYVEPYVIRNYVLDVIEVERETAVERFIGEPNEMLNLEPVAHETTIRPDDDFDATIDGFYSRDISMTSVPDYHNLAGLVIDMSIPINDEERVRCNVIYDKQYVLSRIILYEERRMKLPQKGPIGFGTQAQKKSGDSISVVKTNKAKAEETRPPLQFLDIVGSFAGDASSRRTWRLGGGFLNFRSRGSILWDGDSRVRKETEMIDQHMKASRTVVWGEMKDEYSKVLEFDGGDRMILLPSGCWVTVPVMLTDIEGNTIQPMTVLDTLSAETQQSAYSKVLDLALHEGQSSKSNPRSNSIFKSYVWSMLAFMLGNRKLLLRLPSSDATKQDRTDAGGHGADRVLLRATLQPVAFGPIQVPDPNLLSAAISVLIMPELSAGVLVTPGPHWLAGPLRASSDTPPLPSGIATHPSVRNRVVPWIWTHPHERHLTPTNPYPTGTLFRPLRLLTGCPYYTTPPIDAFKIPHPPFPITTP
eukprot:755470-Hanusia_phi.AAC.3